MHAPMVPPKFLLFFSLPLGLLLSVFTTSYGQGESTNYNSDLNELPSVHEVFRNFTTHNGGLRNLSLLQSAVVTGNIVAYSGDSSVQSNFRLYRKSPNKMRVQLYSSGIRRNVIYNGEQGWHQILQKNGKRKITEIEGETLSKLSDSSAFNTLLYSLKNYLTDLTVVEFCSIRGRPCVRIDIADDSLVSEYSSIWIDLEHYQELKVTLKEVVDSVTGKPIVAEVYYSEHKKIDGCYVAHKSEHYSDGTLTKVTNITQVEFNEGLFDYIFTLQEQDSLD